MFKLRTHNSGLTTAGINYAHYLRSATIAFLLLIAFNAQASPLYYEYLTPDLAIPGQFMSTPSIDNGNIAFGYSNVESGNPDIPSDVYIDLVVRDRTGDSRTVLSSFPTPAPAPGGGFFGTFSAPSLDGNTLAFKADVNRVWNSGDRLTVGIYTINAITGSVARIADQSTAVPGGTGTFTSFGQPMMQDGYIVFNGTDAAGHTGIYLKAPGHALELVANDTTSTPGIGTLSYFGPYPSVARSVDGLMGPKVVFNADTSTGSAIMQFDRASGLTRLVDGNTGGPVKIISFFSPMISGTPDRFGHNPILFAGHAYNLLTNENLGYFVFNLLRYPLPYLPETWGLLPTIDGNLIAYELPDAIYGTVDPVLSGLELLLGYGQAVGPGEYFYAPYPPSAGEGLSTAIFHQSIDAQSDTLAVLGQISGDPTSPPDFRNSWLGIVLVSQTPFEVPEPSALVILGSALGIFAALYRRRRSARNPDMLR